MTYNITIFPSETTSEGEPFDLSLDDLSEILTASEERLEKSGPVWAPGTYHGNQRSNDSAIGHCCLVYDIDVIGYVPPSFDVCHIWHSTHSDKVRLVFPLPKTILPSQLIDLWEHYRHKYALPVDEACKDSARVYYLPAHKPGTAPRSHVGDGPYINVDVAAPVAPSATSNEPIDLASLRAGVSSRYSGALRAEILSLLDASLVPDTGTRDNTINRVAFCLAQVPGALTWTKVGSLFRAMTTRMGDKVLPEGADHWLAKAERSYERGYQEHLKQEQRNATVREAFSSHKNSEAWREKLIAVTDKHGQVVRYDNAGHNVQLIFENAPEFSGLRFNELTLQPEISGGPFGGMNPNDLDTAISNWLRAGEYGIKYPRTETGSQLMLVARKRSYSPVVDYLDTLKGKWDGTPRIGAVLQDYCGAQGNFPHIARVSRKFFIAAVARARNPGCQVDTALLLQGNQGLGKSSFVRAIGEPWTGTVRLDPRNKDTILITHANWIVELAELQGYRTNDLESIKAYISEREDQIRVPFARMAERFRRHTVFVGTTNDDMPLRDPSGNRRWWPVTITAIDVAGLQAVRDQLWAEAQEAFFAGERWYLVNEEATIAEEEASVFLSEDLEDLLAEQIKKWYLSIDNAPEEVSISDVLSRVLFTGISQTDHGTFIRVGKALRRLRFTRIRGRDGMQRYATYVAPAFLILQARANAEERKKLAASDAPRKFSEGKEMKQ